MNRSIVQALHGLLPALSGDLPPELVDLATSLLAQSRSRASSLKAEEEIARSYACAHVACERLKRRLSLPKIEPRPPCPPKIYQKLYTYLDSALPAASQKKTVGKEHDENASNLNVTPTKKVKTITSRTPRRSVASSLTTSRGKKHQATAEEQLPSWTMKIVRRLCEELEAPAAPHHIYAGVSSIANAWNQEKDASNTDELLQIPALIIAIYFFVSSRLAGIEVKPNEWRQRTNVALSLVNRLTDEGLEVSHTSEKDVRAQMKQIVTHDWTDMDWFYNIQLGSGLRNAPIEDPLLHEDIAGEYTEENQPLSQRPIRIGRKRQHPDVEFLQPGLGTMMQDSVDYLSDERLRDYELWKKDILMRIKEAEEASVNPVEGELD